MCSAKTWIYFETAIIYIYNLTLCNNCWPFEQTTQGHFIKRIWLLIQFSKWLQISSGVHYVRFLNKTVRLLSANIYFHLQWMERKRKTQSRVLSYIFAASVSIDVWIPSLKFDVLHTECKANVDITLHQRMKQARNGSSIDWQARIDFFFPRRQWDSREAQSSQSVAETHFTHSHTHQWFSTLMVFTSSIFPVEHEGHWAVLLIKVLNRFQTVCLTSWLALRASAWGPQKDTNTEKFWWI